MTHVPKIILQELVLCKPNNGQIQHAYSNVDPFTVSYITEKQMNIIVNDVIQ